MNASIPAPLKRVAIGTIKETVARAHALTVDELDNGRRHQRVAHPRLIAMYIATTLGYYSLPVIARDFGKADHTTVMYARDRIKSQMERDGAFRSKVYQLIAICKDQETANGKVAPSILSADYERVPTGLSASAHTGRAARYIAWVRSHSGN